MVCLPSRDRASEKAQDVLPPSEAVDQASSYTESTGFSTLRKLVEVASCIVR